MQDADVLKRVSGPALSPTILHREALVTKLDEVLVGQSAKQSSTGGYRASHYKLVVCCAPAGYGKTTLLADFAQHTSLICCWYFLDRAATDKATFLQLLIRSIQHKFPDFGKSLDVLLTNAIAVDVHNPSRAHFDAVIDALTVAIAEEIPERFALFLCNYHEVNSSQNINDLVNRLLQKLPSQAVVVIESRAVPALDFASLLARDEIVGFDASLLRFSATEIRDLARLQKVAPLKEKEAEQLTGLFDGWIAGILLGTRLGDVRILHSRREAYRPLSEPDVHIDRRNVFAYLVAEVFSREPDVYTFLKETAIFSQMTPPLCDALLDITDAAEQLHYLEQQGLFVTRIGEVAQTTYTCHPILRELLSDELRQQSPERYTELQKRAIEIWEEEQSYEQAIFHALEGKLYDEAARLILLNHRDVFAQGRVETLARWIDALPTETKMRYPELLLVRANIYLTFNEHGTALPLLTMASEAISESSSSHCPDELPLLQATIAIARAEALFQMRQYEQTRQLCRTIIEQIPVDEVALHAEAHTLLGRCANATGDYTTGIANLQKALLLWGRNSERRQTAILHNTLARSYGLIGNFALAEHHLSRAAKCWDRLQDDWGRVNNLLNMGMIKQRQGDFAAAESLFQDALTIARGPVNFQRGQSYALANLGELYQEQGLYEQSLVVTEDALALARRLKDRYLINCTLCTLAMTYLLMGDAETAMFLFSEVHADIAASKSGGYEKVNCELVRGTVLLYQQQYTEAFACLSELESQLHTIGLQWELLCTTLRLTECLLVQGHTPEALRRLNEMATLILRNDYEQVVLRELRILPALEHAVRTMPELERLRTLLHAGTVVEEKQEESPLSVVEAPAALSPTEVTPDVLPVAPTASATTSRTEPTDSAVAGALVNTAGATVNAKARITILALGEPSILIDDRPITRWRMARAMELLFLLLNTGRPMRKEQIITALWPDADDHITQTLHSTIHYLRKSLGESCIASRSGTYWLDLASLYGDAVWYDVAAFEDYHVRARQALENKDDAAAKAEFLKMVELYRGDYVQAFYSDWCTFQRDKLRIAYLDARQQLAQIAWRGEQFDESASHWQQILAVDNCLEDAHYGLMRCYMRQGKRGLAMRQYQRCEEVLERELGVEPGPPMQNLLQHLLKPASAR